MFRITTVRIDEQVLLKQVKKAIEPEGFRIAKIEAERIFRRAYNAMLREFDKHPVTLEIASGKRAVNFSGTLGGYGNLFSFLGFEDGDRPIDELRQLLALGTSIRFTVYRNMTWYFRIQLPTQEAIRQATPMPWEEGSSWAEGIEQGISNLSYFLYGKFGKESRSGAGLQAGWEINEDLSFERTKYLTTILSNFRERINNAKI